MKSVQASIESFLESHELRSLILRGQWGSGKTHMVQDALSRHRIKSKSKLVALVSLYDKESKAQIDAGIIAATVKEGQVSKRLRKVSMEVLALFGGEKAEGTISIAARQIIDGGIICLDDIERSPPQLSLETILSYTDNLVNAHNCKVICIVNDDRLSPEERTVLNERAEKTFQRSLKLVPSAKDVARLSVKEEDEHSETLRNLIEALGVTNIRIGQDINRRCRELLPLLSKLTSEIQLERLKSLAVIVTAQNRMENFPTTEFLKDSLRQIYGLRDDATAEHRQWQAKLHEFGYLSTDDIDVELMTSVERGYFDVEHLAPKIASRYSNGDDLANEYQQAWRQYHDTLTPLTEEFCTLMFRGATNGARQISPLNINSTVRLLRRLQKSELADQLCERYVAANVDNDAEFFDIRANHFLRGEDIDPEFERRMNHRRDTIINGLNPEDVLREAEDKKFLSHIGIVRLSALDDAQFQAAFRPLLNASVSNAVDACLKPYNHQVEGSPGALVREKCIRFLQALAEESLINRVRIAHKYPEVGVTI